MATPRFRPGVLVGARERARLTQLQLATRGDEATDHEQLPAEGDAAAEQARRIRTWESRIGAWERGIDAPSAPGTLVANETRQREIGLCSDAVGYDVERPAGAGFDFE